MTTTRKKLIIDKYISLINELEKHTDKSILPVLGDDFDVVELIIYFNYFFMSCESKDDYQMVVLDIVEANSIKIEPDTFNRIFPMMHDFLLWFKTLL